MARSSVKTFRNIGLRARFLGLQMEEWALWLAGSAVLFGACKNILVNLFLTGLAWLGLLTLVSAKPDGYLQALLEDWTTPKDFYVDLETI